MSLWILKGLYINSHRYLRSTILFGLPIVQSCLRSSRFSLLNIPISKPLPRKCLCRLPCYYMRLSLSLLLLPLLSLLLFPLPSLLLLPLLSVLLLPLLRSPLLFLSLLPLFLLLTSFPFFVRKLLPLLLLKCPSKIYIYILLVIERQPIYTYIISDTLAIDERQPP
jgi:hypothetical protein